MKNLIIYLGLILSTTTIIAQNEKEKSPTNISTTVITLDLDKPHENSVNHSNNKNKLVVKNRNPLAFVLINGNPFRFKYVLNYKTINLFSENQFNPSPKDIKTSTVMADTDGDGIPDSMDENPERIDPPTDQIVISLQNSLKPKLEKFQLEIENYISEISKDEKLNMEEFKLKKANFKTAYMGYFKEFEDIQKLYVSLNSANNTLIQKQDELSELKESIRKLIDKLYKTNDNFTYIHPIDSNGDNIDFIEIQLDIFDGDKEVPITYRYKIWIQGGLKIDFSGGAFITSLFDREYGTTDMGNRENSIYELNNGEYDFGFGTMVNISLRGGSWVKPALNFGALFTSNQKFQMLAGMGLILGKNERFIIHGGLTMGRINTLKDNFVADGQTTYNLGGSTDIPLKEKFQFGNFFGITYNFSKPTSDKDKK